MAAVRGLDTRVMGKQRKHPSARGGSFRSWVSIRQPPCRATGSPPPPAPGTSPRPGGAGSPSAAGSSSPRAGAVWPAASPAPGPTSRGRTCPQRRTRHDRTGLGSAGWMAVIHAAGKRLALSQRGAVVCRGRSPRRPGTDPSSWRSAARLRRHVRGAPHLAARAPACLVLPRVYSGHGERSLAPGVPAVFPQGGTEGWRTPHLRRSKELFSSVPGAGLEPARP